MWFIMKRRRNIPQNPMMRVMTLRDFRFLFSGSAISLLGDQFALIATPWLVLKLTGDPLILGIVLAMEGIPRALFMLVGGAITDRFSPRLIIIISDILRLILTGFLAMAIFAGFTQVWMLYAFGLGFGLVSGFAIPAQNSIVPMIVKEKYLQAGNSLIMGISELAGFVGPTVAGILIGIYANTYYGIGLAFTIDSATFAFSALFLWLIRKERVKRGGYAQDEPENIWQSIASGVKFLWDDAPMRLMFLLLMAVNFLIIGPVLVGIPVLANQRLPEGAVAFGLLMSAYAGGNMAGFMAAGLFRRPGGTTMQIILISLLLAFGLVIGSLGLVPYTWVDFTTLLLTGMGNGYIAIILFTWIQLRTPKEMLGRVMSIVLFSSFGLVPVSQAISGFVSKWNLTLLFVGSGLMVLVITVWAAFRPEMRMFSESLTKAEVDNR